MQAVPDRIPTQPPYLTDGEIDDLCAGLTQNAAKCRYLQSILKVPVRRKPNGRPLVLRADLDHRPQDEPEAQNPSRGPNVVGLNQWAKGRKRGA